MAELLVILIGVSIGGVSAWWAYRLAMKQPTLETSEEKLLKQQDRLEFLQHRGDFVRQVSFFVRLNRAYTPEELGKFYILLEILSPRERTLYLSSRDAYETWHSGGKSTPMYAAQHTAWSADENMKLEKILQDTAIGGSEGGGFVATQIRGWSGHAGPPFELINSFDGAILTVHITKALLPRVAYVGLGVNDYLLLGQPIECLDAATTPPAHAPPSVDWPPALRDAEKQEWVQLVPKPYRPSDPSGPPWLAFFLNYANYTPVRLNDFYENKNWRKLAIPTCDWYARKSGGSVE